MDKRQRREKRNWFLFMIGYFTAGYLAINWLTQGRGRFYDLGFPFEREIPFVAIFIFGYILVYVSVLLTYFIIDDWDDWRRAIIAFLGATTFAYLFFFFLPVKMLLRPDLTGLTGISASVSRFYYLIDLPYNCFPSLHVTYPSLATLVAWRRHHIMRWVFAAMTLIVALSVVLVKQHYVADVAGGFLNASLVYWLTVKSESWFSCCRRERDMLNSPPA